MERGFVLLTGVSGVSRGNPVKEQLRDLCDCSVLTKEFCGKGVVKIVLNLWDSKMGCL